MTELDDIVRCVDCHYYTSTLEARMRRFNEGRCVKCGGVLEPMKQKQQRDAEEEHAN
jgi:hypothetical protein